MKSASASRALSVRAIAFLLLHSCGLARGESIASAGTLAYVSRETGEIAVVDAASATIAGTIPGIGTGARGIAITADGRLLVSANKSNGDLAVVDRVAGKILRRIPIGANPEFVRLYGHVAYVTYEPKGAAAGAGAKDAKQGGAGKPNEDDDDNDEMARIAAVDIDQGKVIRSIVAGRETEGLEFSKDGKALLVTNEGDETVTVFERASLRRITRIDTSPYGKRPRGIKTSPDGRRYAVTLEVSDKILILDRAYKVVDEIPTRAGPYGVAFSPDGTKLFVAAARAGVVQAFDARTKAVIGEAPVGKRCWHFTFTPDASRLLVACGRSNEVIALDAATLAVSGTVGGLEGAWGIVTYPRAMGSLDAP